MTDVLGVAAGKLRDPVCLRILTKPHDLGLCHGGADLKTDRIVEDSGVHFNVDLDRMKRLRAAASTVAISALVFTGCGHPRFHAVVTPLPVADGGKCVRDCQSARSGGLKSYLGCVKACPGTRVFDDESCETVGYGGSRFHCSTEQNMTFSTGEIVVGIIIGVILLNVIALIVALA